MAVFFGSLVVPVCGPHETGATLSSLFPSVLSVMSGMLSVAVSLHVGLESDVGSGPVFHDALGTVGFQQGVLSDNIVAFSVLLLGVDVVGVGILHSVLEVVSDVVLKESV